MEAGQLHPVLDPGQPAGLCTLLCSCCRSGAATDLFLTAMAGCLCQGSGGFGTVFCATWRGREVAVKVTSLPDSCLLNHLSIMSYAGISFNGRPNLGSWIRTGPYKAKKLQMQGMSHVDLTPQHSILARNGDHPRQSALHEPA